MNGARDPRDLREGGAWTLGQRGKNGAIFAVAIVALAAARALPRRALACIGRWLGALAFRAAAGARATALENLLRVFPEMPEAERYALARRSFASAGEGLADAVALLRADGGPLLPIAPASRAVLAEALAEGRGVVFASAHLGPWERVAASLVAAGLPFTAVARESYDPRFTRLYEQLRGRRGVRVVWRSGPGAAARIVRVLRDGGVLGVPMDLASRVPSCAAPFLGHTAATPVGPARIALRTGAAVVVGTVAPAEPGGPLIVTATRIPTAGLSPSAEESARALTEKINLELSRRILALPHAWVWMHRRWASTLPAPAGPSEGSERADDGTSRTAALSAVT